MFKTWVFFRTFKFFIKKGNRRSVENNWKKVTEEVYKTTEKRGFNVFLFYAMTHEYNTKKQKG